MKEVFGIELMGAYHAALTGQPIHVDPQFLRPRAIMTFYPRRIGAFLAVRHEHEAALRALDGFVRLGVGVAPGETVGPADEGFLPTVSAEVTADSIDDLLATVRTAHNLGDIVEVSSF